MRSHYTCRPNRASKSRSHYIVFGWGPIGAMMICLNAAVGICVEWHSDDGINRNERLRTGSNLQHVQRKCRATVVASPASATVYQSATAGERRVAPFDRGQREAHSSLPRCQPLRRDTYRGPVSYKHQTLHTNSRVSILPVHLPTNNKTQTYITTQ